MTTALTVTSAPIINSATHRQVYVTVLTPSTPAQASNTIIYDPTTTPYTTSGTYVATKIRGIRATSSIQGASGTLGNAYLTWDASTPVVAVSVPTNAEFCYDSSKGNCLFEPLTNQGGTGVSGKIGLTTTGLVAGDTLTFIIDIING